MSSIHQSYVFSSYPETPVISQQNQPVHHDNTSQQQQQQQQQQYYSQYPVQVSRSQLNPISPTLSQSTVKSEPFQYDYQPVPASIPNSYQGFMDPIMGQQITWQQSSVAQPFNHQNQGQTQGHQHNNSTNSHHLHHHHHQQNQHQHPVQQVQQVQHQQLHHQHQNHHSHLPHTIFNNDPLPRLPTHSYMLNNPANTQPITTHIHTPIGPPVAHLPSVALPVSAISSAFVPSTLPSRSSISSVSSNSTTSSLHSPISPITHCPSNMYFPAASIMTNNVSGSTSTTATSSNNTTNNNSTTTSGPLRMIPDIGTSSSLFQMFENTPLHEPHMLYCKKCALFKPAVEFASTTGFFNNNCKHCRNYRRKGEDAKSEAVQELYRVSSYEQLKNTLYELIRGRRANGAPLICVHFYLDPSFIGSVGEETENDRIDSPRYHTVEGRSILANSIVKEVKQVDRYSYNHRSTRVFKSGETHKYLCSQSTALPWRQKKRNAAVSSLEQSGIKEEDYDESGIHDPDLHNCSGTVLVKFKSPGQVNQRVCVAYCHDVSHTPKASKK